MSDASMNYKQPDQVDWSNFNPPSKFVAPPVPLDAKGNPIVFQGTLPKECKTEEDKDGYMQFVVDPITLKNGYEIRFTRASTKLFERKMANGEVKKQNANKIGTLLKSASIQARPQTNEEYIAAVKAAGGRTAHFTIDWSAYNKDNGESVDGYLAFPEDPERPGQRKAILKQGDTYHVVDRKGNIIETKTVISEVLFANARIRYFVDPARKQEVAA